MTRDQFVKYKFRAYQQIDYKHERLDEPVRCMIIAINFDTEVFTLQALEDVFETEEFYASISCCSLPKFIVKK